MEELTMIVNAVKEMAAMGSQVGMWWIVLHYSIKLLVALIVSGTIITIVFLIVRAVSNCGLACQIRNVLNVGSPGCVTESERREVFKKIAELMGKQKS